MNSNRSSPIHKLIRNYKNKVLSLVANPFTFQREELVDSSRGLSILKILVNGKYEKPYTFNSKSQNGIKLLEEIDSTKYNYTKIKAETVLFLNNNQEKESIFFDHSNILHSDLLSSLLKAESSDFDLITSNIYPYMEYQMLYLPKVNGLIPQYIGNVEHLERLLDLYSYFKDPSFV